MSNVTSRFLHLYFADFKEKLLLSKQIETMEETVFGIGSRIRHPDFGEGVVVQVKPATYLITFMQNGMREISRNFDKFEIKPSVTTYARASGVIDPSAW